MARMAARVDDMHICPLTTPTIHIGGLILLPCATNTRINGKNAARVGDRAFCNAPAPDTVREGLITVFIDGNPASRILDKTDVGTVVMGSPDVLLGEWGGGPLTEFQAQWLYNYLASQEQIPFEYATDGCFARADRMALYMERLGVPVEKQWSVAKPGSYLHVNIPGYSDGRQVGGVTWGWHVAPVVSVQTPGNSPRPMVIDPSLGSGRPVSVGEWIGKQTSDPSTVDTFSTSSDVYFSKEVTGTTDEMRDLERTAKDLENYRDHRAIDLPPSTGRNIPNRPVHY